MGVYGGGLKFSLLHPSRGRPEACAKAISMWYSHFSGRNKLEYILSLDYEDAEKYADVVAGMSTESPFLCCVRTNASVVEALNNAALVATGDVLIYVSDDFECPQNWDALLAGKVGQRRDEFVVFVNDCRTPHTLQTICILSREYYARFGYVYHPSYFSVFVDNEFTEVARRTGRVIEAFDLTFKHRHYSEKGGMPFDETYARENSDSAYSTGRENFERRRARNFDL